MDCRNWITNCSMQHYLFVFASGRWTPVNLSLGYPGCSRRLGSICDARMPRCSKAGALVERSRQTLKKPNQAAEQEDKPFDIMADDVEPADAATRSLRRCHPTVRRPTSCRRTSGGRGDKGTRPVGNVDTSTGVADLLRTVSDSPNHHSDPGVRTPSFGAAVMSPRQRRWDSSMNTVSELSFCCNGCLPPRATENELPFRENQRHSSKELEGSQEPHQPNFKRRMSIDLGVLCASLHSLCSWTSATRESCTFGSIIKVYIRVCQKGPGASLFSQLPHQRIMQGMCVDARDRACVWLFYADCQALASVAPCGRQRKLII